jgi:hypothetical protein
MGLHLENLDDRTRQGMLAELELDVSNGKLYLSSRLTEIGKKEYQSLFRQAIKDGNDAALAERIRAGGLLGAFEEKRKPDGTTTTARVPITAAETLAEGEFNRFYIRALCRRAIEDNIPELVIYRAKQVTNPRPDSQAKIGKKISAKVLLEDLRTHQGIDTALGLPAGPNSGLSVRLP